MPMNPLIPTYQYLFESQLSDLAIMDDLKRKRKGAESPMQKEKIAHQMRILNRVILDRSVHLRTLDESIYYSGSKTIKELSLI